MAPVGHGRQRLERLGQLRGAAGGAHQESFGRDTLPRVRQGRAARAAKRSSRIFFRGVALEEAPVPFREGRAGRCRPRPGKKSAPILDGPAALWGLAPPFPRKVRGTFKRGKGASPILSEEVPLATIGTASRIKATAAARGKRRE